MAQPGPSAQTEGTAGAAARPAQPRARLRAAPAAGRGRRPGRDRPGRGCGTRTERGPAGRELGAARGARLGRPWEGAGGSASGFLGCKCGARAAPGAHGAGITLGGRAAAGEGEPSLDGTRPPRPGRGGGEGWRCIQVDIDPPGGTPSLIWPQPGMFACVRKGTSEGSGRDVRCEQCVPLLEKTKKITDLLSRWRVPVQKEAKLSLQVPAVDRLFLSGLRGIVSVFYLGRGYRTVCL